MSLGDVELFSADQARKWARDQLAAARLGDDPMAEKKAARVAAKVTLGSIADLFLKAKQGLRPKSLTELTRYLKVHWAPLSGTPLHLVTQRDVAARITEIEQTSGTIAASHARLALSGLYVWAMQQGGLVESNPVINTANPGAKRVARDRVLSDAELTAVWRASDRNDDLSKIVRLLILLGQRRPRRSAACAGPSSILNMPYGASLPAAPRTSGRMLCRCPKPRCRSSVRSGGSATGTICSAGVSVASMAGTPRQCWTSGPVSPPGRCTTCAAALHQALATLASNRMSSRQS
jgi:hypothetical protein